MSIKTEGSGSRVSKRLQLKTKIQESIMSMKESQNIKLTMNTSLTNFFSSIVDDAIDQLYILGAGTVPKTVFNYENIKQRAMKCVADDPLFDHKTGDPFEESFQKKKLLKLYFDSSKIADLLLKLRNELKFEKNFTVLTEFLNQMKTSKMEEEELFAEEKRNFDAMNAMKQMLVNEQKDSMHQLHVLNENTANLKDETEDVVFQNLLRIRYINDWEKARNEQNHLTNFQKETELENTIAKYKNEIEKENRVNTEIEMYITENQKDMDESIEEWMEKYDKDAESRMINTAILKEKREELRIEHNALQELYNDRQEQIDAYLLFKENRRKAAERLVIETKMAIKIQAWWRGTMVRKQLGPFKVEKPETKKKSNKDKEKDKKKKK